MSSYGRRGPPWGPHDWEDFYFFWKCVFVVLCVVAATAIYFETKYPNVCEQYKAVGVIEKDSKGREIATIRDVCTKWKEYK